MIKKLSEISIGKKVIIHSLNSEDFFIKLMEMGCLPGEIIYIQQVAPLGDPLSVVVAGYQLSLRKQEAETILVEEIV